MDSWKEQELIMIRLVSVTKESLRMGIILGKELPGIPRKMNRGGGILKGSGSRITKAGFCIIEMEHAKQVFFKMMY